MNAIKHCPTQIIPRHLCFSVRLLDLEIPAFVLAIIILITVQSRADSSLDTWAHYQTLPPTGVFGLGYGNGLFVVVGGGGYSGSLLTSPDSINWTLRATVGGTLRSVTYGNGTYVAVGDFGNALASPDGVNWTLSNYQAHFANGVAYGNGRFVTVGNFGWTAISSDGVNWTPGNTGSSSNPNLFGVTYANGIFVAVGGLSDSNNGTGVVWVSSDGVTWTQTFSGLSYFYGVAFGNNQFVAVGQPGTIMTSPDGVNWTLRLSAFGSVPHYFLNKLQSVTFGDANFVAVGGFSQDNGFTDHGQMFTSTDGITWVPRNYGTSDSLATVTFGNSTFATADYNDNIFLSSSATFQVQFKNPPTQVLPTIRPRLSPTGSPYILVPHIDPTLIVAAVTDASGNPQRGVSVRISISGDNSPGGHDGSHAPTSVHGWIFYPLESYDDDGGAPIVADQSFAIAVNALGGSIAGRELDLTSGPDGEVAFTYIPAEASGIDTFKAEVTSQVGVTPAIARVSIILPGLTSMMNVQGFPFSLFGVTPKHSENWFAAANTISGLQAVSQNYLSSQTSDQPIQDAIQALAALGYDFPNDIPIGNYRGGLVVPKGPEILFINDISLAWGGLFDIDGDFASTDGHGGHRDGSNVDLKSTHLVSGSPYLKLSGGQIQVPSPQSAVGDYRLMNRTRPFSNTDFYLGANGKPVFYTDNIRNRMNKFVMQIHYERLLLLLGSLETAGCSFAPEGDHIHVKFP